MNLCTVRSMDKRNEKPDRNFGWILTKRSHWAAARRRRRLRFYRLKFYFVVVITPRRRRNRPQHARAYPVGSWRRGIRAKCAPQVCSPPAGTQGPREWSKDVYVHIFPVRHFSALGCPCTCSSSTCALPLRAKIWPRPPTAACRCTDRTTVAAAVARICR